MSRKADIAAVMISLGLHIILFFAFKSSLFYPTQFSVSTGDSSVEVELIAASEDEEIVDKIAELNNKASWVEEKKERIEPEVLIPSSELEKFAFTEKVEKTNRVAATILNTDTTNYKTPNEVNPSKKSNQTIKATASISRSKSGGNLSGYDNETLIAKGKGAPAMAQPDYLKNSPPVYPEISRRLKEEGTVWLKTSVNAQGRATQVNVLKSSGFERLDKAAQNSVKQWRFKPAHFAGLAVESIVEIPIIFQLK